MHENSEKGGIVLDVNTTDSLLDYRHYHNKKKLTVLSTMAAANPAFPIYTATQILSHGLQLIGIDHQQQARRIRSGLVTDFKSHYGPHPLHAAQVWRELLTCADTCPDAFVDPSVADLDSFFYALFFLRVYPSERVRARRFKVGMESMREKSWFYVKKIGALKLLKIRMPGPNEWVTTFIMSVDGSHFQLNEPRDPNVRRNRSNYSEKFNSAGVNYEVAVALFMQRIVWIRGPMRASVHDKTAFQEGLMAKIPHGKRIIVDNGYEGVPELFSNYNQFDTDELKWFKRRAKSRQETLNARMAIYQCLDQRFRHKTANHGFCFDAVAVLTQYAIEDEGPHGEPLFDI